MLTGTRNKQLWKRIGVIMMAAAMLMNLSGCTILNMRDAPRIKKALEEAHGEEFAIRSIGGRLYSSGSDTWDNVTAHCYPVSNPDLIFEVRMDGDGNLLQDEYLERIYEMQVQEMITEKLEAEGLTASVLCTTSWNKKYNDDDELNSHKDSTDALETVFLRSDLTWSPEVILQDNENLAENVIAIEATLQSILQDYPNMPLTVFDIRLIETGEYETCAEVMAQQTYVSDQFFYDYTVNGFAHIKIESGEIYVRLGGQYEGEYVELTDETLTEAFQEEVFNPKEE